MKSPVAPTNRPLLRRLRPAVLVLVAALATLSLAGCASIRTESTAATDTADTVATAPSLRVDEIRGLWVIRTALSSAAQVRTVVEEAHASGFNTLLVQVRGRGDALYDSQREPRAESLATNPSFDPLQLVIEAAQPRGMAVHAWVNTHLVWGPTNLPRSAVHLVNAHPEWLAVPRSLGRQLYDADPRAPGHVQRLIDYAAANPTTVEGLYTSPSHPAVQEHVRAIWMDLAINYDLDGIHFDYIRFPSAAFDYSRGALDRFRTAVRQQIGPLRYRQLEVAAADDPYAFADALPDLWNRFRRDHISALVRRIYRAVKAVQPDLIVSAAVFPDRRKAREMRFQAWSAWLADGFLDVAVPMAYTTDGESFETWIEEALTAAGTRQRVWAGVGAYKNPVDGTLRQIQRARRVGTGGVVVFAYGAAASTPAEPGAPTPLEQIGRAAFGAAAPGPRR